MPGTTTIGLALLVLLSATGGAASAGPPPSQTVVVLPVENVSGTGAASSELAPLLRERVLERGWAVADAGQVESALEELRIRYLDSLEDDSRDGLAARFGASGFLLVTAFEYRPDGVVEVALAARLIDAGGRTLWGDVVAMTAADSPEWFGIGADAPLPVVRKRALDRLFGSFPPPGATPEVRRGKEAPLFLDAPPTYRSEKLERGRKHRVCILPIENATRSPAAARVVGDILGLRLRATGEFDVVEAAEFRRAMREEGIRSIRMLGPSEVQRLARRLRVPLFVRGTVYQWSDPGTFGGGGTPSVQVELSAVDMNERRLLWTSNNARRGDEYRGFLLRGEVTSVVALGDRVVGEMVNSQQRAVLRSTPEVQRSLVAEGKAKPGNEKPDEKSGAAAGGAVGGVLRDDPDEQRQRPRPRQR